MKQALTIFANLTSFAAILAGLIGLGLLGLSLGYHPRPRAESLMWLGVVIAASVLPVIVIWTLKAQRIKSLWFKNVLSLALLSYGGLLTLQFGWGALTDSGDFIIWFPLCLYGIFIVVTACLLVKAQR